MNETNIASGSGSCVPQRILAAVLALPFTAFAALVLRHQLRGFEAIGGIFGLGAACVGAFCWWFALRGHFADSRARMKFALLGGGILGGIGFAAGYFGPILLTPQSNQGPLLGIFITGPLGFVLGAAIGWAYAHFRVRRARPGGISHDDSNDKHRAA